MPENFTIAFVKAAACPEGKSVISIGDTGQQGLFLRVTKAGFKSFYACYRIGGEKRWHLLGSYPALTIPEARRLAKAALGEAAAGRDPHREKVETRTKAKALKAATAGHPKTVADLFAAYIDHRSRDGKKRAAMKEKTVIGFRSAFNKHLEPSLGGKRLAEVTARLIENWHAGIPAATQANRAFAVLRAMFSLALKRGWIEANPFDKIEKDEVLNVETTRDRRLSVAEIAALGAILPAVERGEMAFVNERLSKPGQLPKRQFVLPIVASAVRLLLLTGLRRESLLSIRRDQIQAGKIVDVELKGRGNRRGEVYLSRQAKAEVESILRRYPEGEFLITSPRGGRLNGDTLLEHVQGLFVAAGIDSPEAMKARADEAIRKRPDLSPAVALKAARTRAHDLRRTFESFGFDLGLPGDHLQRLTHHATQGMSKVYQVASEEALAATNQKLADAMELALDGKLVPAEVVDVEAPLETAKAAT